MDTVECSLWNFHCSLNRNWTINVYLLPVKDNVVDHSHVVYLDQRTWPLSWVSRMYTVTFEYRGQTGLPCLALPLWKCCAWLITYKGKKKIVPPLFSSCSSCRSSVSWKIKAGEDIRGSQLWPIVFPGLWKIHCLLPAFHCYSEVDPKPTRTLGRSQSDFFQPSRIFFSICEFSPIRHI